MKLVINNAQIARISNTFNYGDNKQFTAMNVVIIAPIKVRGEKGMKDGEYHCKVFNKKVMSDINKALSGSLYIDFTGHVMYGRYEPKGVINTTTGKQHSQAQWDFILEGSTVVEHPRYATSQPNAVPPTPPAYIPPQPPVQPPVKPTFQTVNTVDYPSNDYPTLDDIFND